MLGIELSKTENIYSGEEKNRKGLLADLESYANRGVEIVHSAAPNFDSPDTCIQYDHSSSNKSTRELYATGLKTRFLCLFACYFCHSNLSKM